MPEFEIPYHTQIMEAVDGIDMDAAGRVAGQGFYYLMGDVARLHSGILSYARDFMIGPWLHICDSTIHDPFISCNWSNVI